MHRVSIERGETAAVVVATGELDLYAAPDLSSAFAEVRREGRVVTDLDRVSFMDSTALGLIVRATRELSEAGTDMRIVLPSGHARRIFEITALDKALPVSATIAAALEELVP